MLIDVDKTGAGGGSRTRLSSLGSSHTTDVLRPLTKDKNDPRHSPFLYKGSFVTENS